MANKEAINSVVSKDTFRKCGRPSIKNKKSEKVMAYFTRDEKELIQKIADSKNLSVSKFVSLCALQISNNSDN